MSIAWNFSFCLKFEIHADITMVLSIITYCFSSSCLFRAAILQPPPPPASIIILLLLSFFHLSAGHSTEYLVYHVTMETSFTPALTSSLCKLHITPLAIASIYSRYFKSHSRNSMTTNCMSYYKAYCLLHDVFVLLLVAIVHSKFLFRRMHNSLSI